MDGREGVDRDRLEARTAKGIGSCAVRDRAMRAGRVATKIVFMKGSSQVIGCSRRANSHDPQSAGRAKVRSIGVPEVPARAVRAGCGRSERALRPY